MTLFHMSIYGAVLILAILIIRAVFLHKLPKKTFLILWAVALVRLLIPFEIASSFSLYSLLPRNLLAGAQTAVHTPNTENPQQDFEDYYEHINSNPSSSELEDDTVIIDENSGAIYLPSEGPTGEIIPLPDTDTEGQLAGETRFSGSADNSENGSKLTVSQILTGIRPHLPLLWAIGAGFCAVFFLICYLRCLREFRTALPVTEDYAAEWLKQHPLRRTISIRQSDKISTPLTYGMLRPVILLPKNTDWENKNQINYVLYHEFTHIRRFDLLAKLVMIAALCLHWFNPFVWAMYVFFNRDLELSCDDCVVKHFGESKSAYAGTLIGMEEKKNYGTPLCNHFSKNAIEERITAIMKSKKTTIGMIAVAAIIVVAVIITLTTGRKNEDVAADLTPTPTESITPTGSAATPTPSGTDSAKPTPAPGQDYYFPERNYLSSAYNPPLFVYDNKTVSPENDYNFVISSFISAGGKKLLSNLTIDLETYAGGTSWQCMATFYDTEADAVYLEFIPTFDVKAASSGILHVTIPVSNPTEYTVHPAGQFENQNFWFNEICKIRNRIYFNHASYDSTLWVYDITTSELTDLSYVNENMQELANNVCADLEWEKEPVVWTYVWYESADGQIVYQGSACEEIESEAVYSLELYFENDTFRYSHAKYIKENNPPSSSPVPEQTLSKLFADYRTMHAGLFLTELECTSHSPFEEVQLNGTYYYRVLDENFPTLQSVIDYMETICTPEFAEELRNSHLAMDTQQPFLTEHNGILYTQGYHSSTNGYTQEFQFTDLQYDGSDTATVTYQTGGTIYSNIVETGTILFRLTSNGWRIADLDYSYKNTATESIFEDSPASLPTTMGPNWYNAVDELMHGNTPEHTTVAESSFSSQNGNLKCTQPSNENGHIFTISTLTLWEEKKVALKNVSLDLSKYTTSFVWQENGIYYDEFRGEVYVVFSPSDNEAEGGIGMVDYQILLATIPQVGWENYTIRCYGNPETPLNLGSSNTYNTTKINNLIYLGGGHHNDEFYAIDINTKRLISLRNINEALNAQAKSYLAQCGLGTEFTADNRVVCETNGYIVYAADISYASESPTYFTVYHAYYGTELVGKVIFRHKIAFYDTENLSHAQANYISMDDVVTMAKEAFASFCNNNGYSPSCEITSIHMTSLETISVEFCIPESDNPNTFTNATLEFTYNYSAEQWNVSRYNEIPTTN